MCRHRARLNHPLVFRSRPLRRYALIAAFAASSAAADEANRWLDTVVVTGTRTERALLDVPVRTEVVSREALETTHARDLADALRHQPGLLLQEIHGKSGTEVWLQGLNADRVLVLVNGRPVSASTGSTVDLSQLSVGEIDRVEIVKGAVSALYGSSAMGGVVNIITRRPSAPWSYIVAGDVGSFGDKNRGAATKPSSRHAVLDLSANSDRLGARLSADLRDSDGFDLDKSTFRYEGDAGPKFNLNGELAWRYSTDNEITFTPAYYREDLVNGFADTAPGIGEIRKEKREFAERATGTLAFRHRTELGSKFSGYVMHESFDNQTAQDVIATPEVEQERNAQLGFDKAEIQWDQPLGESQLLTLGLVAFDSDLEQSAVRRDGGRVLEIREISPGARQRNIEFFAQNDIFIGEHWELLPGLRIQDDREFGSHLAPKLNLMYRPSIFAPFETRVRAGIGSGYRTPNLKERFFVFDHSQLGYMVLGNPSLNPEQSMSYQAGFEISHANGSRAEFSLFHNDIEDLIDTGLDQTASALSGLQVFKYINIARARTRGAELSFGHAFSRTLSVDLGYSYLDTLDRDTGHALTRRPEHQITAALDWRLPVTDSLVSLRATHQTEEFIDGQNTLVSPGWTRVDLKLNQPIRHGLKFYLGIDNLNDEHRDPARAGFDFRPKQGRFIYAGLRLEH
ncbi:MAG: TonB-dependent receptor plug domain-containing protein [Thiotrichales bacterium]